MGYFYAVISAILWGLIYTIHQKILTKTSPQLFLVINSIMYLMVVTPFLKSNEVFSLTTDKFNAGLIICTSILSILGSYSILKAIQYLDASRASIIEISYPMFVMLFSWIAYRQQLGWKTLIGGLLVFMGSAIVVLGNGK